MIFAGTPATTALAGTSFVTTAPAATTLFSPRVTPASMVACAPDPYVVSDDDGRVKHIFALCGGKVVVERRQHDLMPYQHAVPHEYAALVLKTTTRVDEHVVADADISAAVGVEGREQHEPFADLSSRQFAKERADLFLRPVSAVHLRRDLPRAVGKPVHAVLRFRRRFNVSARFHAFQKFFAIHIQSPARRSVTVKSPLCAAKIPIPSPSILPR